MSGAKQHFIPRMLLRAFRMNAAGKVARVRVFRADRHYTSPVEDVAAERFFYSNLAVDGTETLDDAITRYETGLASDLAELNAASGPVSPNTAARVVTHLLIRNDHVRGVMRAGANAMADLVESLFGSNDKISSLFGAVDPVPGAQFRKIFEEHVAGNAIIEAMALPPEAMIPITHMMLRESSAAGYGAMTDAVEQVASRFRTDGPTQAKDAHARTLTASLAPQQRIEILEGFDWHVEERADLALILPDFVALGWDRAGAAGSLLEHGNDDLAAVAMPLSPRRALIGIATGAPPDLGSFNETAIPHCLSFFVASAADSELEVMASAIGQKTAALLSASLEESAAEFRVSVTEAPRIPDENPAEWAAEPLGSIELHTDCIAPENAIRLNAAIGGILRVASPRFDIRALRRIVIMADYDQALASLDRGRFADEAPPPTPSTEHYSVAYNVNVEADGIDRVDMVLRDDIAAGLLGADDLPFSWAASVVLGQLARIGMTALTSNLFEEGIIAGDQIDILLFPSSMSGWETWFVAGLAGALDPKLKDFHRQQLCDRLASVPTDLTEIRRAYRVHGDINRLIEEAGGVVARLFESACAVASDIAYIGDAVLDALLAERGLENWFALLRMDLPTLWKEGTAYPPQEVFLVLNQHMRRLFMLGAIFFWDDDGTPKIEVPYWSDIEWMQAQMGNAVARP